MPGMHCDLDFKLRMPEAAASSAGHNGTSLANRSNSARFEVRFVWSRPTTATASPNRPRSDLQRLAISRSPRALIRIATPCINQELKAWSRSRLFQNHAFSVLYFLRFSCGLIPAAPLCVVGA